MRKKNQKERLQYLRQQVGVRYCSIFLLWNYIRPESKRNNTSFLPQWINETMNVVWLFNSQNPLNLNLTKYVLYINCFELKFISVESGTIKFKYAIKIWKQQYFEGIRISYYTKFSFYLKQMLLLKPKAV